MERLISLFREPDYESGSPSPPDAPPQFGLGEEPLYFRQLLEYLRERKQEQASSPDDELIRV